MTTFKQRAVLVGHPGEVLAVAFSRDGRMLASADDQGNVRLWVVATSRPGPVLASMARPTRGQARLAVYAVAFSPDNRILATGGGDQAVRLWDLALGKELGILKHTKPVRCLAITADGKLLISRTEDGVVMVWDLAGRREVRHFSARRTPAGHLRLILGPGGESLAINDVFKTQIEVWAIATGHLQATLNARLTWQVSPITAMAFTPDGKVLAGTTMFGARILFWNAHSGALLATVHFTGRTSDIAFSPDGRMLASAHGDGAVRLWDSSKLVPGRE